VVSAAFCLSSIVACRCLRSDARSGIAVGVERIIMYVCICLTKTKTRRTRCAHVLNSGIKFKRNRIGGQATVPSQSVVGTSQPLHISSLARWQILYSSYRLLLLFLPTLLPRI
jgi:hypothetical protein